MLRGRDSKFEKQPQSGRVRKRMMRHESLGDPGLWIPVRRPSFISLKRKHSFGGSQEQAVAVTSREELYPWVSLPAIGFETQRETTVAFHHPILLSSNTHVAVLA